MAPVYRKIFTALLFSSSFFAACSQTATDSLMKLGDTFYKQKQYAKAAPLWAEGASLAEDKLSKNTFYYYAANAYAYAKDSINSFKNLNLAVYKYGYNDLASLKADDAFFFMDKSARWAKLIKAIKPPYSIDPLKSKVIDTDVRNFWKAYDMVQKDTAHAIKFYKETYIDKGTNALQFFYVNKIHTMADFVRVQWKYKKFYKSIRANSFKAAMFKQQYLNSFVKLKKIYPQALFPNIYFVIGKFNSGGTSTSDGVIIGIDMRSYSASVDTSELGLWQKKNLAPLALLPYTVAHEMVHCQQKNMSPDTTLLKAAIVEGMADFIGELISGKSSNERLLIYGKGKEKQIWVDFKKEMYLDKASNWIANGDQETPDKPADLGYWVGYQICKAYYDTAKDKQQAIYDMLHITDYKKFLEESKLDNLLGSDATVLMPLQKDK